MNSLSDNQVSLYEEPVQEKIRKFIKIEFLLNKIYYFKSKDNKSENYIALLALCELYEILSRSDIKSELIREIETQNSYFEKIKEIPQADSSKLNSVLEKQNLLLKSIYNIESNYLDYLEHDILFKTILKNCFTQLQPASIDFWLSRDILIRETQIDLWLEPLIFIKRSIDFILEVIRKSGRFEDRMAEKGFFIEKLDIKRNILLIRVTLTSDLYYYPQISVGKQRLTIMFMTKDDKNNLVPYQEDLNFILTTCSL
ncbi:MAG: cell division protein ZapD [Gammaproteobacteria bacterium]|nr:cell division protein ZapD [Gammaproteobacteria bacterium]|tara:strand:- start:21899 stop:22666 length:768 start_codon:yes stop_codon:yes gene_type:complete